MSRILKEWAHNNEIYCEEIADSYPDGDDMGNKALHEVECYVKTNKEPFLVNHEGACTAYEEWNESVDPYLESSSYPITNIESSRVMAFSLKKDGVISLKAVCEQNS